MTDTCVNEGGPEKIPWRNLFLILGGGALVYGGSLKNDFLWDDQVVLVANGFIKNWRNIFHLFGPSYFVGSGEYSYRPVATLSYIFGFFCWGLSRWGFHGFSLLLHLLCGVSVFIFLREVFKKNTPALLASALFLLHPANSEAVLEVSFNEELLCTTFFVWAFYFYVRSRKPGAQKGAYVLSLACYFLALFSKEIAILLPVFLFLYDRWSGDQNDPPKGRSFPSVMGFGGVTLFYLWIRFFVLRNPKELGVHYIQDSFLTNSLTMAKVFFLYWRQLLWPFHLSPDPFVDVSTTVRDPKVFLALLGLAGMGATVYGLFRRSREWAFFFLWIAIGLLPVMNLIPFLKENFMADRYLYLPSVGFCALLSSLTVGGGPMNKKAKVFWGVILLGCAVLTFRRTMDWRDAVTFWGRSVATDPQSVESHNRLGAAYAQQHEFDRATDEYQKALRLNPASTRALNNLGNIYYSKGQYERAIQLYDQNLAIDSNAVVTYANRGSAHKMLGHSELAIMDYQRAVQLNPAFAEVYLNLAMTYQDLHQPDNARRAFDTYQALRKK